jgi:hypothetical protein
MRKLCISVVIGGLAMMPLSAMSQNMASAPNAAPKADHMLFVENGNKVPASAKTVRVEGRADAANAVKQELVKQGAPADKISVRPVAAKPLMKVGDGLSDPTERKVEIKY